MQTFLPSTNFTTSSLLLDKLRLGKQIIETAQILAALEHGEGAAWLNHPATQAWRFHIPALKMYGRAMIRAYEGKHSEPGKYDKQRQAFEGPTTVTMPPWLTSDLCNSHKGHLFRKDPEYYSSFSDCAGNLLLYPVIEADPVVRFGFVERPRNGKFRPVPASDAILYNSVKEAAQYTTWFYR